MNREEGPEEEREPDREHQDRDHLPQERRRLGMATEAEHDVEEEVIDDARGEEEQDDADRESAPVVGGILERRHPERPDDEHRRPHQDREDERSDDPAQEERRACGSLLHRSLTSRTTAPGSAESSKSRIAAKPEKRSRLERSASIPSRSIPPMRKSSAGSGKGGPIASRTEGVRGDFGFEGVGKIGPRRTRSAPSAAAARASAAEWVDLPTRNPRGVSRRTGPTGRPARQHHTPAPGGRGSNRALARTGAGEPRDGAAEQLEDAPVCGSLVADLQVVGRVRPEPGEEAVEGLVRGRGPAGYAHRLQRLRHRAGGSRRKSSRKSFTPATRCTSPSPEMNPRR